MHPAVEQIRQYLQLIALQFVQHPEQAELRVAESRRETPSASA